MRRFTLPFLLVALTAGLVLGSPPTITFPKSDPTPDPIPAPSPLPPVPGPAKLLKGQWYAVSSTGPLLVEGYGIGEVVVSSRKGPVTMPSVHVIGWAPDADDTDFVTIPGPHVYLVKPGKTGPVTLRVQSAVNSLDTKGVPIPFTLKDVIRKDLAVNTGVIPAPEPEPDINPDVVVPIPEKGLRVMIVYNEATKDKLTNGQAAVIFGKKTRDYLRSVCVPDEAGKKSFQFWPSEIDTQGASPIWQKAFARKRDSLPWVIISNGTTGFEGPLADGEDAFIELVKKYAK